MKIIIPSKTPVLAVKCVESLLESGVNPADIVVVTDDVAGWSSFTAAHINVIYADAPFVFASRINLAIHSFPDEDYFILNDDALLLTAGGVQQMERIAQTKGMGVLSAAIKGTMGHIDQHPRTPNSVREASDFVSFVACIITKEAAREVGLLDENFRYYGWEDNDYCRRVRDAGLTIAVYDGCVFEHRHPSSTFGTQGMGSGRQLMGENVYHRKWTTPTKKTVFVIGTTRSGASLAAGIVNALGYGVPDPPPSHERNTSNYYRDADLAFLARFGETGLETYLHRRSATNPDGFGIRAWPRPDGVLPLLNLASNPVVIFTYRNPEAQINSFALNYDASHERAKERIEQEISDMWEIEQALHLHPHIQIIPIHYERLLADPQDVVAELAEQLSFNGSIVAATDLVDRWRQHWDSTGTWINHPSSSTSGWGKIAIGVRVNKYPEPRFLQSYTGLLRDGLEEGDKVLPLAVGLPSHWAANHLMRMFLNNTDADTLMLLDDDMTFSADSLKTLRENEENWRYDIVSGLCTQRVYPPRAIVMRKSDEQPPYPDSLNGIYYDMIGDEVRDNLVMPVDATGFAFTLIRRSVLEQMLEESGPKFSWFVHWGQGGEGEDVYFCRRAGSLGFTIAVDTSVHIGHIGETIYGYDEFDAWRRGGRLETGLSLERVVELIGSAFPHLPSEEREKCLRLMHEAQGAIK